jgi:hypothetical protein
MTSVYVAAKFEEAGLARSVMNILEDQGYDITHDWTDESVEGLSGTGVANLLQEAAVDDIQGVQSSDVVVLLHNDKLWGACWEAGAALGLNKPVIVIGAHLAPERIFYWHPDVLHVPHIDGALALLKTLFPEEAVTEGEEDGRALGCDGEEAGCAGCPCGDECEAEEIPEEIEGDCPCPGCLAERAVEDGIVPQAHIVYFIGRA